MSESDVYRRHILTYKVDPRAVCVNVGALLATLVHHNNNLGLMFSDYWTSLLPG